jgi:cell division protein ZapE
MRGPLHRYRTLVEEGALAPDAAQEALARKLQDLEDRLARPAGLLARLVAPARAPRGLYVWGGVGRGKSLLMDVFFNNSAARPKRRVHFHEFMAETHARLDRWRKADAKQRRRHAGGSRAAPDDPLPPAARDIAAAARLLCFDEFQVTDIADAMVLGRLFEALLAAGVVIVATANRPPDDLYKDGINRQLFLPFIALMKRRFDVVELAAARDYRLDGLVRARTYYSPLGPPADAAMDAAWRRVIAGGRERAESIEVHGRSVLVRRVARDAARFGFEDLFGAALGPSDYLAIAARYAAIFVDRAPVLGPDRRDAARRFVTFIDAVYEAKSKLVMSAAAEPGELYPEGEGAFEFARAASRLHEMRSEAYLGAARSPAAPGALHPGAAAAG